MKISIKATPYELPIKHPFTTSRYTVNIQKTMIVSISDGTNIGLGEATVNPYYHSTIEKIQNSIKKVESLISRNINLHPEELWNLIEPALRNDYFALCAIDCAFWDFYAQKNNKTTRSFWSTPELKPPLSNYTIGIDSITTMKSKIEETPWPIYKIKLGTHEDVKIVSELRKISNANFRIDANCAWTVNETIKNSIELQKLGVEFIEQPLHAEDWEGMKILKEKSALPLIADESCQRCEDVEKCGEGFHGINIKLMKCGGLTPALRMIKKARNLNLKVMAGCMTESTIGISSLIQIAPLLDYIDADGALLLKNDIAEGAKIVDGTIHFNNIPGSGASLLK